MNLAATLAHLKALGLWLEWGRSGLSLRGDGVRPSPDVVGAVREHRAQLELLIPRPPNGATLPGVVRYVTRPTDLDEVALDIARQESVGFDVETTGLDPILDELRLVQVAIPGGATYVLDFKILGGLGPVVEALRGVEVVAHNAWFDLAFAAQHLGLRPRAAWCTQAASKLLDGGLNLRVRGFHTLSTLSSRWLGIDLPKDDQTSDWSKALSPHQIEYAARDAAIVLVLRDLLRDELEKEQLTKVATLEFALLPVIVDMGCAGVGFDSSRWRALVERRTSEMQTELTMLQKELRIEAASALDESVNVYSTNQVLAALRRRGLLVTATSKEALAPHAADPVVQSLLRFRSASSFVRGPAKAFPEAAALYADRRIRARFNPLAAPTGRFGCSKPNLQGLEKARLKRSGEGAPPEPRSCIVPAPGCVFVVADYAAIELRVLAQITRDQHLMEIFRDGGDPHRSMAATLARKPYDEVTKDERNRAKPVNFGFPFGMGIEVFVGYALTLYGVVLTEPEAKLFKEAWKRMYPGVVRWQDLCGAAKPLAVRTRLGRKRRFESKSSGYTERLNMPVQGTAADGMKNAMVLLHKRLPSFGARIVLTVHDELVVECPREHALAVLALVEQMMIEGMSEYVPDVPIVVEADIRTSWSASDVVAHGELP